MSDTVRISGFHGPLHHYGRAANITCMPAVEQATNRPRFSLIAVLMFALLAVAVGVAWIIVQQRTAPHGRGAEMVGRIREEGLSSFWQRSPHHTWVLIRRGQGVVGWNASVRMPLADGGFEGLYVRVIAAGDRAAGDWEYWRLNDDATTGRYEAGVVRLLAGGERATSSSHTSIELSDNRVEATQTVRDPRGQSVLMRSSASAPDSYAPEGTISLLRRLIAETGDDGAFHVVFNEQPPLGDRTAFGSIHMERREPPDDDDPRASVAVALTTSLNRDVEQIYLLDDDYELVAGLIGDMRLDRVERDEVMSEFPEAEAVLTHLMRRVMPGAVGDDNRPARPFDFFRRMMDGT